MPGVAETRTYDALLTTTLANYREQMIDNITDEYPTLSWLTGKLGEAMKGTNRLRKLDGGESIVEHIFYEFSSAVGTYTGYGTIDLTPQEGSTIARYNWRQYGTSVTISGLEQRSNQGEAKMVDILKYKTMQAENSFRDRISRDIWSSLVGGSDGKSLDGLGIQVDSTGTVGGLSQATYPWWASTETASGSFAAQGLRDMRTLFNTISFGNNTPDYIVAPQTVYEYFETALQPQERYQNTKAANSGFSALTFKGVPYFFDRDAIAGTIFMLNSRSINFVVHKDAYFATGKFVEPDDQDAKSAKILLQANITVNERRKHGKLTGVTA